MPVSPRLAAALLCWLLLSNVSAAFAVPIVTYSWFADGDIVNASLGSAMAVAGDVNGDGFSDVLVSAPLADTLGQVWLYLGSATGLAATPAWTAGGSAVDEGFGTSISSAGDVNGDGYDDVIVGDPGFTNGQTREGKALVYLGSSGGLSITPAWSIESNVATAQYGQSVSTAGDINGDGYDDVVVGAPLYEVDQTDEGRVFIYFGAPGGLGTTPVTIDGNQVGAAFGAAVSLAGDVNADGYGDVLAGSPGYKRGLATEGRVTVYLGNASGISTTPSWSKYGLQAGAALGMTVSLAGDVNGDGYADVLAGAPLWDGGGFTNNGHVVLFLSSSTGLDTIPAWTLDGQQMNANVGIAASTAGDVNADGYADLIVGAPFSSGSGTDDGQVLLFTGAMSGVTPLPGWTGTGGQSHALYGSAVASLGDVNGDGFGDFGVGSPHTDLGQTDEGVAFAYHGLTDPLVTAAAWAITSGQAMAHMGVCSSAAGDVNGDGFADFLVGTYRWNQTFNNEGRLQLFLGGPLGPSTTASWNAYGGADMAWLGLSANPAGDVNGDGYGDVVVGAPQWTSGGLTQRGKAELFLGGPTGLASTPAWETEGDRDTMWLGVYVNTAGDLNGDGYADVVIGSSKYSNGQYQEGRVDLYMGSASGLATSPVWSMESNAQNAQLGVAAGSVGDVNGDGYSDLALGAWLYPGPEMDAGRVWVFHGSSSGIDTTASWIGNVHSVDAHLGLSIADAGDVDGDGYSDLIVGANGYDLGAGQFWGRAYVWQGSPTGLESAPSWTFDSDQDGAHLGVVGTAGDVNGDGYSDVVVSAPLYDAGAADTGRAYLFLGSATGLTDRPVWVMQTGQALSQFGNNMTGVGDVNADGFSDVLVGSDFTDAPLTDEGSVFLFAGGGSFGRPRPCDQRQVDGVTPIAPLGLTTDPSSFVIRLTARSAAGRARVRIEAETQSTADLFDGSNRIVGPLVLLAAPLPVIGSTATLTATPTGLSEGTVYHWRARATARSPFFPRSRWFSPSTNALTEDDVRTPSLTAVGGDRPSDHAGTGRLIQSLAVLPVVGGGDAAIRFALESRAHARVVVSDTRGRVVAVLSDEDRPRGSYAVVWNGRDAAGVRAPSGVYTVTIIAGSETRHARLVRTP